MDLQHTRTIILHAGDPEQKRKEMPDHCRQMIQPVSLNWQGLDYLMVHCLVRPVFYG